jgi:hypothetical protein
MDIVVLSCACVELALIVNALRAKISITSVTIPIIFVALIFILFPPNLVYKIYFQALIIFYSFVLFNAVANTTANAKPFLALLEMFTFLTG